MRLFRIHPIHPLLLAAALLLLCQRPCDGHAEDSEWRPQAAAAVLPLLRQLEPLHAPDLRKTRPTALRWQEPTRLLQTASLPEVAFSNSSVKRISAQMRVYTYNPNLVPIMQKGVPCLTPESVLVHMASKPSSVRSWNSALEWLPDLVYETENERILQELEGRPNSVKQRTGYLLQNVYPEASASIRQIIEIRSKVRFGPREKALRNDEAWMISDTILPVSPKEMEKVK